LGRAPPPFRERPAPPRPRQRLRRRRPPLHVPSELDAPRRLPRPEPDPLPEDLGPQRLLLPVEGVGLPDGAHLDDREDGREHAPRRAPRIAPGWTLEKMAEHTLSFWLTSEDLPHPDNRVTVDRDGR